MDSSVQEHDFIATESQGGVLILRLLGKRLDASMAPMFKAAVIRHVDAGSHRIVLDMSKVDFMDSSALGAVVSCMKSISTRGSLAISGTHGAVLKLLKLTRLDRVLKLYDSTEDAAKALQSS